MAVYDFGGRVVMFGLAEKILKNFNVPTILF